MQIVEGVIHRGRSWAEGNRPSSSRNARGGRREQGVKQGVSFRALSSTLLLIGQKTYQLVYLVNFFSSFIGAWRFNFLNIC